MNASEEDAKSEESMDSFVKDTSCPAVVEGFVSPDGNAATLSKLNKEKLPQIYSVTLDDEQIHFAATEPGEASSPVFAPQQRRPSPTPSFSSFATAPSQTGSIPPTPAHDFFQAYEQESDASAASLVFKPIPAATMSPLTPQQTGYGFNRSRLQSHDSAGSNNSFRRTSPRNRRHTIMTPTNVKPHLLPYSERRKLLQQRQTQRQQQQQSTSPYQPYPLQGAMPFLPLMQQPYPPPMELQQQQQQQQLPPYHDLPVYPMPHLPPSMPPYPNLVVPPTALPMQQMQQQQQQQEHELTMPVQPPLARQTSNAPRPGAIPQRRLVPRPPPPRLSSSAPALSQARVSSVEAMTGRYQLQQVSPTLLNHDSMPPPPPPLLSHAPPPVLVRQTSTGSVSSLGSMDRSGRGSPLFTSQLLQLLESDKLEQPLLHHEVGYGQMNESAQLMSLAQHFAQEDQHVQHATIHDLQQLPMMQPADEVYQDLPETTLTNLAGAAVQSSFVSLERSMNETAPEDARVDYGDASLQHHVPSIQATVRNDRKRRSRRTHPDDVDASENYASSSGASDTREPHERTRLLPPSGATTSELMEKAHTDEHRRVQNGSRRPRESARRQFAEANRDTTMPYGNLVQAGYQPRRKPQKKKRKKKNRSHAVQQGSDTSDSSLTSNDSMSKDHWMGRRQRMLDIERARLIKQWKSEARAEAHAKRDNQDCWCAHVSQWLTDIRDAPSRWQELLLWVEPVVANLPLTIGAIALAVVNIGVDWFKFAEEHDPHCMSVHFHSASQCSFPEFPGCYYCDTHTELYRLASAFRLSCLLIGGLMALTFLAKLIFYHRIVVDELSSPTTAAPAGLVCAAFAIVFAGKGLCGMIVVAAASMVHVCLVIWFIYMAMAYRIMPEPSWFPNTVAVAICALKIWLYFPAVGHFLMAISMALNFILFPTSLIRVALNKKIKAPVAWMQMTAPNISLYAMTIMAQPSFQEEHPDVTNYQKIHRAAYLPCMHFLFGLVMLGMVASVTSLFVRWKQFRQTHFSPAHAAFCNPCLYHASAIQAYRAAVKSFSGLSSHHPYLFFLYVYWLLALFIGTLTTVWITSQFLWCLKKWTNFDDLEVDTEPPAPHETTMTLSNLINTGDTLIQPFVSPAILQANETGQLIFARDIAGRVVYRRTLGMAALGFEPIMTESELLMERELLADFVGKNPPRRRNRTLSVPGIDFSYGTYIDAGASTFDLESPDMRVIAGAR
ncbi:hypothetical protein MPSEU_000810000 [Mayamaea pseudoterrestris]|nr:hypothetical protein MPSEU_000810000 [Mayamaea pseudoterrestris]